MRFAFSAPVLPFASGREGQDSVERRRGRGQLTHLVQSVHDADLGAPGERLRNLVPGLVRREQIGQLLVFLGDPGRIRAMICAGGRTLDDKTFLVVGVLLLVIGIELVGAVAGDRARPAGVRSMSASA